MQHDVGCEIAKRNAPPRSTIVKSCRQSAVRMASILQTAVSDTGAS